MKKFLAIAALAIFTLPALNAQESTFNLGDQVVNLGIGLGSTLYGGFGGSGIPPLSVSFEKAIKDEILEKGVIGVGGYVGFSSYKYRYSYLSYDYGWNYTNIVISALGNFHYPLVDKLDTYAGVMLGYNIGTVKEYGDIPTGTYSDSYGGLVFASYVGARYYFKDNMSAFAQLGYGIAYLTLGVSFKL
ncbi:MAG: hypothetical protein R2751_05460 [Bacteroidales bacterium]